MKSTAELYGSILRRIVYPAGDRVRGVPIGSELARLRESQWWNSSELSSLAGLKLQYLVHQCFSRMPAYRRLIESHGVTPIRIRALEDLRLLPPVTKDFIRTHFDGGFDPGMPRKDAFVARTGGSTGDPVQFYISRSGRAADRASYYRCLEWANGGRSGVIFSVWGALVVANARQRWWRRLKGQLLTRKNTLDAFAMAPPAMDAFLAQMRKHDRVLLRGYTTALADLAHYAAESGIVMTNIVSVVTTAEQLQAPQRELLERVFHAPVFDQYGCGEAGGIASECSEHKGLHIALDHIAVEILDDDFQPCPPGVTGKVVITALDNTSTPFIRYCNGDEAMLLPDPCACGRGLPLMSAPAGRTSDMIYGLNGARVHGEFFSHLLHETGWTGRFAVRQFQVVQLDRDLLRFDIAARTIPDAREQARVADRVRDYLGPMRVEFRAVEQVDRSQSGKRRFTLRLWQP